MRATEALVAWACTIVATTASAQPAASPTLSPAGYAATLARLATDVERLDETRPASAQATLDRVPPVWRVMLGDRSIDVSTDWLRRDLNAWQSHPDAGERTRLADHLRWESAEAASAEPPVAAVGGARGILEGILAQREFQGVRGSSWLDRQLERVLRWLLAALGVAITSSTMSVATTVLAYGLIGVAVVLVAVVMYRAIRYGTRLEPLHLEAAAAAPLAVSLDDARRAAERGDWREAIHVAYWTGIQTLETRGVWRPDRARTPREYLRLLPPVSAEAQPLRALTELIERVWYAGEPADASRFEEAITHLRHLGCLRA